MKNRLLQDSLQYIKGVGPKRAALFEKLELRTTEDCLFFLPFRFEDRTRVKKISQLIHNEQVTVEGTILNAGSFRIGRRKKIFEVIVQDETGTLRAKWFQFNEKYMLEKFPIGKSLVISGKPVSNRRLGIGFEMIHPECEILTGDAPDALEIGKIIPVYHTTEGLHLKSLRTILKTVVDHYADLAEEFLPEEIMRRHRFPPRQECLRQAHFPAQETDTRLLNQFKTPAQQRLIFEELFLIQLALGFKKKHASRAANGTPLKTRGATIRNFFGHLPFELTGAQKRVLGEIMNDLEQDRPMNRLLQGDVGSGKTVVALICLLTAVDNGYQAALMAPTELLSEQHYLNLKPYCDKLGIPIELVTSTATGRERKRIQEEIRSGKIHIIIGTHALIQKDVSFDNLALAVIDEQHRFGVLQREAIGKKGGNPHLLIMTATPIPRSLALTLYGDLDVSYLDEFPPGRQPIPTRVVQSRDRETAYRQIRKEILQGRQAYVVCPLIEESENSDLKAAVEVQEQLKREWFPDLQIALIHGRMKKEERQKIMADFLAGAIHILVATTVIEVGIDVPNATLMIVEHAERFGLSQLHQLRGRVGRGQHASHCFLLAYPPLSDEGRLRLQAMEESNDGFRIAEEDLKIRGPGDFMGTRQSGMPLLRVANLLRDLKILDLARKEAFALIDSDPRLDLPQHKRLKDALHHYMGNRLSLMDII